MQISLKWVNELVHIETVNLENLIEKLTLGGFEVEEISEITMDGEKRITLNISATANRSDSLSIQGISLEIAALLNKTPKVSKYSINEFHWSKKLQYLSNNFIDKNNCLEFLGINLENIDKLTSPKWLKKKLICSNIQPENNFKDFQNYILLETGYPFEFYDLGKIRKKIDNSNFKLNLRSGKINEKFLANNNVEYNLDNSILIVEANQFPISISGIISHKSVECTKNTKSLLVEGSIFNAAKIRRQSRQLGLRTARSSKYEKALQNIDLINAFYQLISLLRISNPNLICKFHTLAKPIVRNNRTLVLSFNNIKKVLGPTKESTQDLQKYISVDQITKSLKRLNFDVKYQKINQTWQVVIPSLRSDDIIREIDLIEEIGRLYGFDNFLTRLPKFKKIGEKDLSYKTRQKLTNCLLNLGLNELIQYSLVNKKTYNINEIELINPLVKDYANLRSSLLFNLLKSIKKNISQSNLELEGFEYGHVFFKNDFNEIQEIENIAGVFGEYQVKKSWVEKPKLSNWFEAKGKIEHLFKKLNLSIYWKYEELRNEENFFHPYCSAVIYLKNRQKLGNFGQIHPITARKLNLSLNLYLFEFNFKFIQNELEKNQLAFYQEYSTYPKIIKDLSFVVNKNISFNYLEKVLYLNSSHFLKEINLIDKYLGKDIPINKTSLCLQFIFQSDRTTLQTKEIENILNNIKRILSTKFDAKIRT
uniref:Phenylalanine--tRNA ligase beta subunit, chloroplastic n=1 Tax=Cylindrotheca closterium TaxID=2856 RepID=A0A023HAI3_9STRA|nr:phenylalanine-tRNA ligase beta subunit [Cylindrotheca closterium]AGH28665.1 phenylalanine-tRNA ligase beta subunit [Cylindrotheca closterium]